VADEATILLYALSTLAQTCAALAAFVGAVGLYKLQSLRATHGGHEHTIRGLLGGTLLSRGEVHAIPLAEIIRVARINVVGPSPVAAAVVESIRQALVQWDGFADDYRSATRALIVFEAWNLLVIGASLVGFNYVPALASSPVTFWAIWVAAVGTVGITVYCVVVWTRE
jgi:hypothetical protein